MSMRVVKCCALTLGILRPSTICAPSVGKCTSTRAISSLCMGYSRSRCSRESNAACMGEPTVQRLILVWVMAKLSPKSSKRSATSALIPKAEKKLGMPSKTSPTPGRPDCTIKAAATPLRLGIPAKTKAFSICSRSRNKVARPLVCCAP